MEEQEKKGFVVRDRRKIVLDEVEGRGNVEAAAAAERQEPKEPTGEPSVQEKAKADADQAARKARSGATYPQVTFSTFVFSLSSSALVHLGEVPDPSTQKVEKDLPLAKQIIDTLAMLQEKTKGNLDKDEEQLLQTVLYDLRLRFVKQSHS
ncbi:DUF1844 domain-containing protein [Desulfosoma caldarium]|uniref:Uncharacterized protein DUF1844 n=1 Tax=Desulfosoma caldarium TaxID=610254 RepID=A0A3N1UV17_9BACT|nr:DUF1844 domain-containing protein [Desulfosoma caldarium]ROQ90966.1 uncharacterized protein DUF1844 [Desulfosoma caldarium]